MAKMGLFIQMLTVSLFVSPVRNQQMIGKNGVVRSNAYSIFICKMIVSKIQNFAEKYFVFNVIKLLTLKTILHEWDYRLIA